MFPVCPHSESNCEISETFAIETERMFAFDLISCAWQRLHFRLFDLFDFSASKKILSKNLQLSKCFSGNSINVLRLRFRWLEKQTVDVNATKSENREINLTWASQWSSIDLIDFEMDFCDFWCNKENTLSSTLSSSIWATSEACNSEDGKLMRWRQSIDNH